MLKIRNFVITLLIFGAMRRQKIKKKVLKIFSLYKRYFDEHLSFAVASPFKNLKVVLISVRL